MFHCVMAVVAQQCITKSKLVRILVCALVCLIVLTVVVVQQRATKVSKSVRDSRKLCSNSSK
jgi:hypothetical protein